MNLYEYFSFLVPYASIYRSPAAQPLNFIKIFNFASSGMQPFQTNWVLPVHVTTHS